MVKQSKIRTPSDALQQISAGLRRQALRPNIFGYNPHEKQVRFHSSKAKGRLFLGGNRSGKTVGGATEAVWWATGTHPLRRTPPPPTRGRIVSVDFTYGIEQITRPELSRWLPLSELKGGSWSSAYNMETKLLTLENGSTIEFMSYEQQVEKFAGTSRHWIWFDEEPPKDIYTECMARLIDTGGHWWITMTPVEGMTWVFDEIYMKSQTDASLDTIEVDMGENPHLLEAEIDSFLAGLSKEDIQARVHGKFVQMGGLVYAKHFSKKNILEPILPPKDWMHFEMMDHGYRNPTAWYWGAVNKDGICVIYDEWYKSELLVGQHAEQVHVMRKEHDIEPAYVVGDPSIKAIDPITGTSILIEYMEAGIPIVLGNNDEKAGIQVVQRRFTGSNGLPHLYICSNCPELLREVPRLRWATWATRKLRDDRNRKEQQHKKDDHGCDALRYGMASRPEHDDGSFVPDVQYEHPDGASAAIAGFERIDEDLAKIPDYAEYVDEHLGAEW